MGRIITVKLGDEEIQIEQLRSRQASEWRKGLGGPVRDIVGQVSKLVNWSSVDLSDAGALGELVGAAMPLLTDSLDTVREMVVGYAPALREQVESAYDDEIVAAFVRVIQLAFPFESMMAAIRGMRVIGPSIPPTSPSSASASGAAGTTS